ncbi:hypothetical protein TNCT_541961 [Trichonephila clavata]|uniref:Uncharacterized protein n=1 Tax=Trichonephila clavata TaxID=2740835 RepID=A0A8X6JBF5_TRICU|nr:hypothetical protein TNCT_541961 [Trichonephila clavata]
MDTRARTEQTIRRRYCFECLRWVEVVLPPLLMCDIPKTINPGLQGDRRLAPVLCEACWKVPSYYRGAENEIAPYGWEPRNFLKARIVLWIISRPILEAHFAHYTVTG